MRRAVTAFVFGLMAGGVAGALALHAVRGAPKPPAAARATAAAPVAPATPAEEQVRAALDRESARRRSLARELARLEAAAQTRGMDPAPTPGDAHPDPATEAHLAELTARVPATLASGDAHAVLGLLKEMLSLGTAAYPAALDYATRILALLDARGPVKIGLRDPLGRFWRAVKDDPFLLFIVRHAEADPRLRHEALLHLNNFSDLDLARTATECLPRETGDELLEVWSTALSGRDEPAAIDALLDAFRQRTDRPQFRARVLKDLVESESAETGAARVLDAMKQVRDGDADPEVRAAAALVVRAKDPPVAGYLIAEVEATATGGNPGLQAGDIVTRLNGAEVPETRYLGWLSWQVGGKEEARLTVNRGGAELELRVTGDQLRVRGVTVRPRR